MALWNRRLQRLPMGTAYLTERPGRGAPGAVSLDYGRVSLQVPNDVYSRPGHGELSFTGTSTNCFDVPAVVANARGVLRK